MAPMLSLPQTGPLSCGRRSRARVIEQQESGEPTKQRPFSTAILICGVTWVATKVETMTVDIAALAHAETMRLDIHEVVRRLNSHLGATMVAALSGSRDSKLPYKWAKNTVPNVEAQERLRFAHRIWRILSDAKSDHIARTWFRGTNPVLGEVSPVIAIREGRYAEVAGAADSFVSGNWSV